MARSPKSSSLPGPKWSRSPPRSLKGTRGNLERKKTSSRADAMRYRTFGRTGWTVSEIGYGMWGMAGWTGSDDAGSLEALQRSADLGCTFYDTAWGYGAGRSEGLLGQLVRANPDKTLYVATKIPPK